MAYEDVQLFTYADMEKHAAKQVQAAVKTDRRLVLYNWFTNIDEFGLAWFVIGMIVVVTAAVLISIKIVTPEPPDAPVTEQIQEAANDCVILPSKFAERVDGESTRLYCPTLTTTSDE
jgi:hypothetical protein